MQQALAQQAHVQQMALSATLQQSGLWPWPVIHGPLTPIVAGGTGVMKAGAGLGAAGSGAASMDASPMHGLPGGAASMETSPRLAGCTGAAGLPSSGAAAAAPGPAPLLPLQALAAGQLLPSEPRGWDELGLGLGLENPPSWLTTELVDAYLQPGSGMN
jgi:hypothetical protein